MYQIINEISGGTSINDDHRDNSPNRRTHGPLDARPADCGHTQSPLPTEHNLLTRYFQRIAQIRLLTHAEETGFAQRARLGDREARDMLIVSNLRLVVSIAQCYRDYGMPFADLVGEGNIGLIKAADRFKPDYGARFTTYAGFWIRCHIRQALSFHGRIIRLPTHVCEKNKRIRTAANMLIDKHGREPRAEEIAHIVQMPANKVALIKSVSARPYSLDAPVLDESNPACLGELIGDESAINPADFLCERAASANLNTVLDALPVREAKIIRLRFGLNGSKEMTLQKIGLKLRLSRERVRQLQNQALSHIRQMLATNDAVAPARNGDTRCQEKPPGHATRLHAESFPQQEPVHPTP